MSKEKEPVEKEMSPEEMEAMRKRMSEYYKSQLPLLRLQAEHQKLIADIEQDRYRAMEMSKRQAILILESQQVENSEKPKAPAQERKLKPQ